MNRRLAFALGVLSLAWPAGMTQAAEPAISAPPGQSRVIPDATETAPPPTVVTPLDGGAILEEGTPCCEASGCAESEGQSGHFTGGVGLYVLSPHFSSNPAYSTTTTTGTPGVTATVSTVGSVQDFSYNASVSPRVWLGYVGCDGLGGRVSYWHFDDSATSQNFSVAPASAVSSIPVLNTVASFSTSGVGPDQFAATNNRRLDVIDMEATQDVKAGSWQLLLSGGVRYTHIAQAYGAFHTGPNVVLIGGVPAPTGNTETDTEISDDGFDGAGPTFAIEARRPLGCWGLSLFGSARGALLFGESRLSAFETNQVTLGTSSTVLNTTLTQDTEHRDDLLGVAELQLGAEWSCDLGSTRVFVQPAFVGMFYDGPGTATSTTGNLGFVGFSLAAGINY